MTRKNSLGERLQCLRQRKGLTQAELASIIVVSRETVKDWETDRFEPSCEFLIKLSNFYQVSADYILGINNPRIIRTDNLSDEQIKFITGFVHSLKKNS